MNAYRLTTFKLPSLFAAIVCLLTVFAPIAQASPGAPLIEISDEDMLEIFGETSDPLAFLEQADMYWRTRHIPGNAERSILAAERGLEAGVPRYEALWRIARGCYWVAEVAASDDRKITYGERGWRVGIQARDIDDTRVEGWYWAMMSLRQYAHGIGIIKAFFELLPGKIEWLTKAASARDQNYERGGPMVACGHYWTWIIWPRRDLARARKSLEEATRRFPTNTRARYRLAETLFALGEPHAARAQLEACLEIEPSTTDYADALFIKPLCRLKLKEK